ncbi:MAG: hypothetical protein AAGE92_02165, partial [Cyanobacteria bacterium P01_G01_bin.4]
ENITVSPRMRTLQMGQTSLRFIRHTPENRLLAWTSPPPPNETTIDGVRWRLVAKLSVGIILGCRTGIVAIGEAQGLFRSCSVRCAAPFT